MSKLILHVGMPKTGSSYIQSIVNMNYTLFESKSSVGFLRNIKPHALAAHFIDCETLSERQDIFELKEIEFNDIDLELEELSSSRETVFISSEYFILSNGGKLIEFLRKYFNEIQIVLTARRQDKLLASGYNQDVKALGRTSSLAWSYESSPTFDYYNCCLVWENLGCKVYVIDYDKVKKKSDGLLTSFLEVANLSKFIDVTELSQPNNKVSNESLTYDEVILKLALNRLNISDEKILNNFKLYTKPNKIFEIPALYKNIMLNTYHKGNKAIVDKYLNSDPSSELLFQGETIQATQEKQFNWDPINQNEHLLAFLIKSVTE